MAKKKLGLAFRYAVFKPLTWRSGFLSAVLLSCVAANSRAISQPAPPSLQLPLACIINVDCWIAHYMDDDPSGAAADYLCGHRTYKGHTGVDFAIQDRRVMSKGVPVVASADGTVARVRSDMPDSGVTAATRQSVDTRECGNGVVLQHGDGWETQYCHLKKDSIVVQIGDRVSAGQKLGLIGLSGLTEFPHVHLTVRHTGRNIDPFIGVDRDRPADSVITPCGGPTSCPRLIISHSQYTTRASQIAPPTPPRCERDSLIQTLCVRQQLS